jgi:hypothetical protein
MWQQIIVALILLAALLFIGIRFWKSMTAAKTGDVCCSCGCSNCAENRASREQCQPER